MPRVSRVEPCLAAAAALVVLTFAASPVRADTVPGDPPRLAQLRDAAPPGEEPTLPLQLAPDEEDPAAAILDADPAAPGESQIEVGVLATLDPDSGGTLEESMGGLGADMWSGTPRATILRLLPQLPARHESPALHDLARRLLLSTAIAPPREPGDPPTSLIGVRVERLEAMGLTGAVVDMIAIAPNRNEDANLLRAVIDNRLLLGDNKGACATAGEAKDVLARPYWDKVTVFCQAVAGDRAAATFGANMLAEGGGVEDPAFFTLAEGLYAGTKVRIDSLPDPSPLHVAMAREAGTRLPADVLETESPLLLRALADSPTVTPAMQLDAAERAAMAGAIGPRLLADRYAALPFGADELARAISRADDDRTAVERGLLYQASNLHEVPVARASAVQKALRVAVDDGMYLLALSVYRPLLETFKPTSELAWFAADAARALYVLGRPDLAEEWVGLLRRADEDPAQQAEADLLWPLARLADDAPDTEPESIDRWLAALQEASGPEWSQRAGVAFTLLEALEKPIPDRHWTSLLDQTSRANVLDADPAYLRAFRLAVADGRRGEAVLLSLLLLGAPGVGYAGPTLLAEIIGGLRAVGLAGDARRLAIEAAVEGGL